MKFDSWDVLEECRVRTSQAHIYTTCKAVVLETGKYESR